MDKGKFGILLNILCIPNPFLWIDGVDYRAREEAAKLEDFTHGTLVVIELEGVCTTHAGLLHVGEEMRGGGRRIGL